MALIQVSEIWQFTQIDGFDHISLWKMVINAANIVLYWDLTMKHVFFAYGFTMNNSGIVGLQWGYHGESLEVKLPTIWTDEKQSREEAERRERLEERRVEEKE